MFFILTLSSAVGLAFGNILESIGLRAANSVKSLAKNKFWLGGLFLSIIATLLYYAAMAKYNISLVQPFMALNPALTAILGWKILGEKMSRKIAFAIVLIFCGLLIDGTLAGESVGVPHSIETLWIYCGIVLATLAVSCLLFRRAEIVDALCAGAGFGLSAVFYKSISLDGLFPPPIDLRMAAFAVLYLAAFVCSQMGLRRGRALFVIPLSAAIGLIVPTLGGIIVFGDPFPPQKTAVIVLVLTGSVLFIRE
ncbi:MAG: EamA family transporter [Fibromonadaceae bacterium]|jgi:drug/metabolite transporter (DMT)-like permease|nr:EamA family transporter [Fibromonadaceae bacterium]